MMKTTQPLTLASGSPRRKMLLEQLGLKFKVTTRPTDESISSTINPRNAAKLLARRKALALGDIAQKSIVITADTIVLNRGKILGKPADKTEALEMLRSLSGRTHEVITGVCFYYHGKIKVFDEVTRVTFKKLTFAEMEFYVNEYKPYDKAGAYGIQEWIGMVGVKKIEGDYYNVMGLPVGKLFTELRKFMQ